MAEFDACLDEHLDGVRKEDKKAHFKGQKSGKTSGNYGRGSLATFLSHDITTKIAQIICDLIQESIAKEERSSGTFSIKLDTRQDVTTHARSMLYCGTLCKRWTCLQVTSRYVKVDSGIGEYLFNVLQSTIEKQCIDIKTCVSDSFDGAASMSGIYNGYQSGLPVSSHGATVILRT